MAIVPWLRVLLFANDPLNLHQLILAKGVPALLCSSEAFL
jgi:hypothetical protein